MNDISDSSKDLETARNLILELIKDKRNYPFDVRQELNNDLELCESKFNATRSDGATCLDIKKVSIAHDELNPLDIDLSYFFTKFHVLFHCGLGGEKGSIKINNEYVVNLSGIHNDIFNILFNKLRKTWHYSHPLEIGWVSYDEFRQSVLKWKTMFDANPDNEISDQGIITEINRLNNKIRTATGFDKEFDLIENGKTFNMKKHYRLRINIGYINLSD